MAKPTIIVIDDEPMVLSAVERDLRPRFGDQFRILKAESGPAAMEALKQLKLRNEQVALFLVDQRMPHMSGVELLSRVVHCAGLVQLPTPQRRPCLDVHQDDGGGGERSNGLAQHRARAAGRDLGIRRIAKHQAERFVAKLSQITLRGKATAA